MMTQYPTGASQSIRPPLPPYGGQDATQISGLGSLTPGSGAQPASHLTQPPAPPTRRQRNPMLVRLIATGAVVVVLVGALAAHFLVGLGSSRERRAQNAVQSFMKAYASGDADKVLSYLAASSEDRSLITHQVLNGSVKRAPVDGIQVPSVAAGAPLDFLVSFTIGGQQASLKISVTLPRFGTPTLSPALTPLNLGGFRGLPVTVNGARPTTDQPLVLPGSYTIGVDNKYYRVDANLLTVTDSGTPQGDARPALSSEGTAAFRSTLNQAVTGCLAATTLVSACGLSVSPSNNAGTAMANDGTVLRTLAPGSEVTLANVPIAPTPGAPAIVSTSGSLGTVEYTFRCTETQGSVTDCHMRDGQGSQMHRASIDMTRTPLAVIWS
ncbi:MAG: hypothetical protein Q4G45_00215 [Actinomycetia bacterium]|nr:hypothetical protein [Actinomycetes bacterium]